MTGILVRGLAAIALLGAVAGCGDHKNFVAQAAGEAGNTRFTARFVDSQNGAPVKATITFCGIGAATADSNGIAEFSVFGILSSDQTVSFRVDAPGYASISSQGSFGISSSTNATPNLVEVFDAGTISLNRQQSIQVFVTKDGTPVVNATVVAAFANNGAQIGIGRTAAAVVSTGSGACQVILTSTTNGSGIATIGGIDLNSSYHVFVPAQNLSGGPGFDFFTSSFFDPNNSSNFILANDGPSIAIAVQPFVGPTSAVTQIGNSATPFNGAPNMEEGAMADVAPNNSTFNYGIASITATNSFGSGSRTGIDVLNASASSSIFSADGSVTIFFGTPMRVINDPSRNFTTEFTFTNTLVTPVSTTARAATTILTGTATVVTNSLNTAWTFTPPSGVPLNIPYTVSFYGTTAVNDPSNGGSTIGFQSANFFHEPTTSSIPTPTADNYNGTLASAGNAAQVYLEFAQVVAGTYLVLGFDDGLGNTTDLVGTGNSNNIGTQEPSMMFNSAVAPSVNGGQLGATQGLRFRVPLVRPSNGAAISLGDGAHVTVAIDVRDASGNHLAQTLTLTVH